MSRRMKHRTKDMGFFPCPICGKKPYVAYYPLSSGWATCNGTFFKPHDEIIAYVKWEDPSKLVQSLASKWNQGQFLEFPKTKETEGADE